jgi:hypothetical protein
MARYKITTIIDVHDKVTDKEYERRRKLRPSPDYSSLDALFHLCAMHARRLPLLID